MMLARRAGFAVTIALGTLTAGVASATTPPPDDPATTASVPAPTTTVPAGVVTGPTPPRGGSAAGGLIHDTGATEWDLRRIATTGVLTLVALAVAGHLYGRMQSTAPRVDRAIAEPSPQR